MMKNFLYQVPVRDSPLDRAVKQGSVSNVKNFLSCQAHVEGLNAVGTRTPLHHAAESKDQRVKLQILKILLNHGADVNRPFRSGYLINDNYLNINESENAGKTALHCAIDSNSPESVKYLVERGADLDAGCIYGFTPLHAAVFLTRKRIVRFLLKRGADVDAESADGTTPLHLSVKSEKIMQYLLEHGASVDARDKLYRTPLHIACKDGSPETIELLLERGSDVNAETLEGNPPLAHLYERILVSGTSENYINQKATQLVFQYLARRKVTGDHVSKTNLKYLQCEEFKYFYGQCEQEVQSMMKTKISEEENVYYMDVLTRSVDKLGLFFNNDNLSRVLCSDYYQLNFPFFAETMEKRIGMAKEKKNLIERSAKAFSHIIKNKLPVTVVHDTLYYLNTNELRLFLHAYRNL